MADATKVLGGRYEIVRPVGYGGMAEVFLAHDTVLDRDVAIKVLRDQFVSDKTFVEQFAREAKSIARLTDPNIINVYPLLKYIRQKMIAVTAMKPLLVIIYLAMFALSIMFIVVDNYNPFLYFRF